MEFRASEVNDVGLCPSSFLSLPSPCFYLSLSLFTGNPRCFLNSDYRASGKTSTARGLGGREKRGDWGERARARDACYKNPQFYSYLTSFFPWHFFPSPPVLFAPVTQAISRVSNGTQKSLLFHWIRMKYKVKSDSRVLLHAVSC